MENHLNDQRGYIVRFEVSATFNPKKLGMGEDARDLGLFFTYIGANEPNVDLSCTYSNDRFCLRRFQPPIEYDWNPGIAPGFWNPEPQGIWMSEKGQICLKDTLITANGLKFTYVVPEAVVRLNSVLKIYVNDDLVKECRLSEVGTFSEVVDVAETGKKLTDYLDQAHRVLKILLREFDRVCTKYNLKYYLICGSLLGVVRHGDLIPWDDDVDVAMPRKDFEIFLGHVADEWPEGSDIQFVNYNQLGKDTFLDFMTRIVYMKEEVPVGLFRKIQGKGRTDIMNHMPMDIYVLDNASNNDFMHWLQTCFITFLYGLAMGHRAYVNPADYTNRDSKTQRVVRILSSVGRRIPLRMIFALYEWGRKWNKSSKTNDYFESNGFIYCIPWRFNKNWFGDGKRACMGKDLYIKIPKDADAFLRRHYGDYLQYPSIEARKPTHSVDSSGIF